MRGQALAIALVIASGVATFVMSLSTLDSLSLTMHVFYRDYHFAEVFGSLKRAPDYLRQSIGAIPGVDLVQTRVQAAVKLDIEGSDDPITGQLISLPDEGEPLLNRIYLRQGRLVDGRHDDEVVLNEVFANANNLKVGARIGAIINGRRRSLRVVGIGVSPEFIYQIKPGSLFPDFKQYGVLWMARRPLATAYNMEGAFNNLSLSLTADARLETVIEHLDQLLKPYGGLGAYGRDDQISHRLLSDEFVQLEQMATIYPFIFLAVAAFLLNVVISRLISLQREQVAALKAFGYSNTAVGLHYMKLVLLIVLFGAVAGCLLGAKFGQGLSEMYQHFYHFPFIRYRLEIDVLIAGVVVSALAAVAGTLFAVRRAAQLPPAQAMRPEPPASYRPTLIERIGLQRFFSQPSRMIMRHIERRPVKSLLTITGIAMSYAILVMGTFFQDSIDYLIEIQFGLAQREDLAISFVEPTSRRALFDLQRQPGVEYAEVFRSVPVRLRYRHRSFLTGITGVEKDNDLARLLNTDLQPLNPPPDGILLTDYLGELLGVGPGDSLTVEVLEGRRPQRSVAVAAVVSQFVGVSAYMDLAALNRLMGEGDAISGAFLAVDEQYVAELNTTLNDMPRVAGAESKKNALKNFYENIAEQSLAFSFFMTLFAVAIAVGVVYNSARIALSERSRELASLRVLGFSRAEISYILLGELTVLTLAAAPLGFGTGYGLCAYIIYYFRNDLLRLPLVVEPASFAFAASIVFGAAIISALIVRRRLDHLDLVSVLKTKE